MTRSYMWHDVSSVTRLSHSITRVTWLSAPWLHHMCDMTHHQSLDRVTHTHSIITHMCRSSAPWLDHMCDMTHQSLDWVTPSYVWHDSSSVVTWFRHPHVSIECLMTRSYMWHDSSVTRLSHSITCVTWLIIRLLIESLTCVDRVPHDSIICVTWRIISHSTESLHHTCDIDTCEWLDQESDDISHVTHVMEWLSRVTDDTSCHTYDRVMGHSIDTCEWLDQGTDDKSCHTCDGVTQSSDWWVMSHIWSCDSSVVTW